jgi:hypothetical protein
VEELLFSVIEVHVSDVRQIEVDVAEPLVPDSSSLEIAIATAKVEKV